jgi:hypothetical protein
VVNTWDKTSYQQGSVAQWMRVMHYNLEVAGSILTHDFFVFLFFLFYHYMLNSC